MQSLHVSDEKKHGLEVPFVQYLKKI